MDQLVICDTCAALGDEAQGTAWANAVRGRANALGFEVVTTSCMNVCDRPVTFAVQGRGKATYLFADAKPGDDDEALLALLKLYSKAPDGWIADARPIGRLRECLVGRVPKL